jgi:O-methyltransferase
MNDPLKYAEQIAYSSKETLYFSYEMGKKYKHSDGCFIETGTAAGAQIIAMLHGAPGKLCYAFDSFEGLPFPSNRDDQMPGIKLLKQWEIDALPNPGNHRLETTGATAVRLESFREHIENSKVDASNLVTVEGWFENTIPPFECPPISILRLDGDLFHSTWVCLQYLFPHLIHGGVCVIDDWTLKGCQDSCKEYFELIGYEPKLEYLSTIAYFYK